ncbi:MAG: flavodoxin domain-containing protein [Nitrolancea sp.]
MYTLVVFDTQFGNTEKVARAIGKGLEGVGLVRVATLEEAREIDLNGIDLLVVGGPTQGHRPRPELRSWVAEIPAEFFERAMLATFDTRLNWPAFLAGSAAKSLAHAARRHHARLAVPPESFIVTKSEGPLADGELERATAWGQALAAKVGSMVGV